MKIKQETVFAAELSWPDYATLVSNGRTAIFLPIGAMEQHGHHMSMNVDMLLPTEFARHVAQNLKSANFSALVAPAFSYGYKSQQKSGGGNHFPGTTSLDGTTLIAALRDIIREFARHGVRKICLFNGHFENSFFIVEAVDLACRELKWAGIEDMKIVTLSYWDFVDDKTIAALYPDGFSGWALEHGGVIETSLMLALYPDLVDMNKIIDHPIPNFPPYDVYPLKPDWTPASGTLSSPKQATAEKGRILLQVCSDGIINALREEFA